MDDCEGLVFPLLDRLSRLRGSSGRESQSFSNNDGSVEAPYVSAAMFQIRLYSTGLTGKDFRRIANMPYSTYLDVTLRKQPLPAEFSACLAGIQRQMGREITRQVDGIEHADFPVLYTYETKEQFHRHRPEYEKGDYPVSFWDAIIFSALVQRSDAMVEYAIDLPSNS